MSTAKKRNSESMVLTRTCDRLEVQLRKCDRLEVGAVERDAAEQGSRAEKARACRHGHRRKVR
jgi:hypothetical protein